MCSFIRANNENDLANVVRIIGSSDYRGLGIREVLMYSYLTMYQRIFEGQNDKGLNAV